ncbi:MAG: BACON domain-containing protein [Bacteroidaceae bacterium]|nr:BACON domain-containing protein [Bacteroidaceae bacterium]
MKLKYIFGLVLAALMAVGCSDDNTVDPLASIAIDQTFVSIPVEGGDATITITAQGDWAFDKVISAGKDADGKAIFTELPAWLTADKISGNAGQTTVTLHADATEAGREAELRIATGTDKQFIIVRQGSLDASEATCADVIAAPDGKTFRVTGTVATILNTQYGNWDLEDETGTIRIYGTNDKEGKKGNNPIDGADGWGFEVGDVVTVEGPKSTYGTTVELVDVTVISVKKSLLKVVTPEQTVGIEGGDIDVKLAYKGSGAYAALPADCDWITITGEDYVAGKATLFEPNPADTAIVHLRIAPNAGNGRKAAIDFSSSNASTTSTITWTLTQDAFTLPHGQSVDDPYTVSEALAFVSSLEAGKTTDEDYCVTGIICAIKYTFSAQYGTATFFISEDGNPESEQFQIYSCYYFENQPWKDGDQQIEIGDEVVVKGKMINYNGNTPETASKQAYLASLKKSGPGSRLRPFTADEATDFIMNNLEVGQSTDDEYYIAGEIVRIDNPEKNLFNAEYGNASFYIADDDDPANTQFYVYRTYYLGNRKWVEGDTQIQEGDQVVVCAKLTKYKDNKTGNIIPETVQKATYIYSLNGKKQ